MDEATHRDAIIKGGSKGQPKVTYYQQKPEQKTHLLISTVQISLIYSLQCDEFSDY